MTTTAPSSQFEAKYLSKTHAWYLAFLVAHLPVLLITAFQFGTGAGLALGLGGLILAGPILFFLTARDSKWTSVCMGVATIAMSGLLIHLGRGLIELHFHIFVSLAVLIVFANPVVILAAAATAAVHHLAFFLWLPTSVFNYEASFGVVALHALFVVLETVPAFLIASTFGRFVRAQGEMTETLAEASKRITESSLTLSDSSGRLSDSVEKQTVSLQQTASALEEINGQVAKTTENAGLASETSQAAQDSTVAGKRNIDDLKRSIARLAEVNESLNSQFKESFRQMGQVIGVIANIEEKTKVINDIVFQTKLLSFNASVEAARAGEHGKGFAVVAEEVGNLAAMSGNSAREISSLLSESLNNVRRLLTENQSKLDSILGEANEIVAEGAGVAGDCDQAFDRIAGEVERTVRMAEEIARACTEQKIGLNEITQAVHVVESTTRENSTMAGETARTAKDLDASATELSRDLNRIMKLLGASVAQVEGADSADAADVSAPPKSASPLRSGSSSASARERSKAGKAA